MRRRKKPAAGGSSRLFRGLRVLVTAGPTVEPIDPVRFISNRSSGRMGVAMAAAAARRGARVTLVHGPLQVPVPRSARITAVPVESAREMRDAVIRRAPGADLVIMCAAVADFTPASVARHKLKKAGRSSLRLELVRTPDILAELGALKRRPFLVGFAAETRDVARNAAGKLARKNCDMICANDVTEKGSGFAVRTNRVTIHRRGMEPVRLPLQTKAAAARRVLDEVARMWRG